MAEEVTETQWFNTIKTGSVDDIEDLLEINPKLVHAINRNDCPYDAPINESACRILGGNTKNMNALNVAINCLAHSEVISFLIDEASTSIINATWGDGNTALHLAAVLGDVDIIPSLLGKGAQPNAKNKRGLSPIDVASTEEVKKLLQGTLVDDSVEYETLKSSPVRVTVDPSAAQQAALSPSIAGSGGVAQQMLQVVFESSVFGRPSFDPNELWRVAQSIEQNPTAPTLQSSPRKPVGDLLSSPAQNDPLRDISSFNNAPKVVSASDLSSRAARIRSKAARDSIDQLASQIQMDIGAASSSKPRVEQFNAVLFVKLIEIRELMISNLKAGSQLYVSVSGGKQHQFSMVFKEAKSVSINDEFHYVINDESNFDLNIQIRRKRQVREGFFSVSPIKQLLSPSSSKKAQTLPTSPAGINYDHDEVIAHLTPIKLSQLAKIATNQVGKSVYVLCPPTSEPVLGIVTLQFYLHTDRMATWSPNSFDDCLKLHRERTFEKKEKIWWQGVVNHGVDMQLWKQRWGVLKDGKMYTYEYETREPREVLDFARFRDVVMMNYEECDIRNSFKVTCGQGSYRFFYVSSRTEMDACVTAIVQMMASIEPLTENIAPNLQRSSTLPSRSAVF